MNAMDLLLMIQTQAGDVWTQLTQYIHILMHSVVAFKIAGGLALIYILGAMG